MGRCGEEVAMRSRNANETDLSVVGVSGSLRKGSFNTALLRAGQELAPENMEITIFGLADIPLYDGDVEAEGDPGPVTEFKLAIRKTDGILFATPEYNHSISGVLKNAIDWASRDREEGSLVGKPAAMMGAGGRAGTARAQLALQNVLAETGALVMVKPGVQVAAPWKIVDSEGRLIDEGTRKLLAEHLKAFAEWIPRVGASRGELTAARNRR
jgi:chromate reductase